MPKESHINKESYNQVAANYAAEHSEELVWQQELNKFSEYLSAPKIIIDLGCGHGDETIWLADNLPESQVIGVDFAEEMIALASLKKTAAKFAVSDLVEFTPDEKVDGIWARASLHHLGDEELHRLFEHISTYAEPGLVIGMINKYGSSEEVEEKQKYGQVLRRYFNYFDEQKVAGLAEKYGYKVLEQYTIPESEHIFLVSFLKNARNN